MDSVEQLFKQHYGFVCNIIYSYLKDRNRSEDIAQEIFMELWVKRDQLQIHTSPAAYLRRMAVTRTLNHIRDSKKHRWDELDVLVETDSPLGGQPPDTILHMEEAELRARIDRLLDNLPEKCRLVFMLNRQEEMSYAEVASHLGISIKTVENQIGKALRLLREGLASDRG